MQRWRDRKRAPLPYIVTFHRKASDSWLRRGEKSETPLLNGRNNRRGGGAGNIDGACKKELYPVHRNLRKERE